MQSTNLHAVIILHNVFGDAAFELATPATCLASDGLVSQWSKKWCGNLYKCRGADNCVAQNGQLGEVATALVLYVWQRLRASLYQGGVTKLFR